MGLLLLNLNTFTTSAVMGDEVEKEDVVFYMTNISSNLEVSPCK